MVSVCNGNDISLTQLDDDIMEVEMDAVLSPQVAPSGYERRVEKRVATNWSGQCQRLKKEKIEVVINDVSPSGLGLWSPKPLNVSEKVYVSMQASAGGVVIPLDAILVIQNVVLSNNLFRCGGRFLSITDSARKQLDLFLRSGKFNPLRSLSS